MLRLLASALAALLLSACAYGSAVDMAPMKSRIARPVIPPGAYCEVQQAGGAWRVISSKDCVPVTWDAKTRTYAMEDDSDPEDVTEAAVAALGGDLYLAQMAEEGGPFNYHIQLILAKGEAFALLPALDDEDLAALVAKHPKVVFRKHQNRPYIASGKMSDIKAFLKAAGRESLLEMREEGEPLSPGVRDAMGAPDHPASKSQVKDIEALMKAARKLAPQD